VKLERGFGFERKISFNIGKKEDEILLQKGEILSFGICIFKLKMGVVLYGGF
jgi:hypothetical protein